MDLAPIVLFVYNRPEHTLRVLEALEGNHLANQSKLYIFSDGLKVNASKEDLNNIHYVRKIIKSKNWCKEVFITERIENLGLANSVIKGVSQVVEQYGKVIVLEDDILTGKYFLKFMNDALITYKNEELVFGVTGYKYPTKTAIKKQTYFLPIASSWSYGTWVNRWKQVNFNGCELIEAIESSKLERKMNFGNYPFYQMLKDQINGLNSSWAIRFYASMFLKEKYFLYPNVSLVENIGFDNTGEHCSKDDFFSNIKLYDNQIRVVQMRPNLNQNLVKLFENSFKSREIKNKISVFSRIINKVKRFFSI
tara:strand:+ start:2870 stop:3793 length:924 start_codon:yes stop_codon:yes gene_type:complete